MLRFGLALGFLVSYRTLAWAPIFALGANFCLGKMADLDSWLLTNVGTDARRAEVRAVVESLEDLRWLSDHTALPRGPGFDAGVVMALRRVIGTHRAACARAVV